MNYHKILKLLGKNVYTCCIILNDGKNSRKVTFTKSNGRNEVIDSYNDKITVTNWRHKNVEEKYEKYITLLQKSCLHFRSLEFPNFSFQLPLEMFEVRQDSIKETVGFIQYLFSNEMICIEQLAYVSKWLSEEDSISEKYLSTGNDSNLSLLVAEANKLSSYDNGLDGNIETISNLDFAYKTNTKEFEKNRLLKYEKGKNYIVVENGIVFAVASNLVLTMSKDKINTQADFMFLQLECLKKHHFNIGITSDNKVYYCNENYSLGVQATQVDKYKDMYSKFFKPIFQKSELLAEVVGNELIKNINTVNKVKSHGGFIFEFDGFAKYTMDSEAEGSGMQIKTVFDLKDKLPKKYLKKIRGVNPKVLKTIEPTIKDKSVQFRYVEGSDFLIFKTPNTVGVLCGFYNGGSR